MINSTIFWDVMTRKSVEVHRPWGVEDKAK